ncbi:MAG: alpha-L-fucosidase [Chloroflexota bacterium]
MLDPRQRWFEDARYGLFVHWGMYALYERGEQVLFREHLRPSAYRKRAADFTASLYDPQTWAALAREGGMRYAVLTAKHHDGFCLFDSEVSDFTSVKTGAGRDLVAEYAEAFREAGLRVGLYYSLADWQWPAYFEGPQKDPEGFETFVDYTHTQVRELCSNYGPLDIMWFDGSWPHDAEAWRAEELFSTIRGLQPHILINDRACLPGDFDTPEQRILGAAPDRPWESCITSVERHWGYHAGERLWKTPERVIHILAQVAEGGGNLLLNVGPKAEGTFPQRFIDLVREVGDWLEINGEAIYGSKPGVCECISIGRMTVVDSTIYLHVLYWPGHTLHLSGLANPVRSARFVADDWPINFVQEDEHIHLKNLPTLPPDPRDTVIALEVEGTPRALPWAEDRLWQGDAGRMASWANS